MLVVEEIVKARDLELSESSKFQEVFDHISKYFENTHLCVIILLILLSVVRNAVKPYPLSLVFDKLFICSLNLFQHRQLHFFNFIMLLAFFRPLFKITRGISLHSTMSVNFLFTPRWVLNEAITSK